SAPAAESRADRLAVELLAPEEDAEARLAADPAADPAFVLRTAFGLPPEVARTYARWLRPPAPAVGGDWVMARIARHLTAPAEPPSPATSPAPIQPVRRTSVPRPE